MNPVPRQSQLGPRADDEEVEVEVEVAASDGSLAVGSMHFPSLHPPQSASVTRLRDVGFRESEGMERMDVIAYLLLLLRKSIEACGCPVLLLFLLLCGVRCEREDRKNQVNFFVISLSVEVKNIDVGTLLTFRKKKFSDGVLRV